MAFLVSGTSVNGAAITVDIPAASDIVAVMTWFFEDGGSAATPTVPAGATATQIGTPGTPFAFTWGSIVNPIGEYQQGSTWGGGNIIAAPAGVVIDYYRSRIYTG